MFTSLGDLFRTIKEYLEDPFERVEVAYWWLTWNHAGQASWEYEALSRLSRVFKPGLAEPWEYDGSTVGYVLGELEKMS